MEDATKVFPMNMLKKPTPDLIPWLRETAILQRAHPVLGKEWDAWAPGADKFDQLADALTDLSKTAETKEQAYNAQAGVDTESRIIVTSRVTQAPDDKQEMARALANIGELPRELGTVTDLLADTGHYSEANVQKCEKNGITPYIAVNRQEHHPALMDRFAEPPPFPPDADAAEKMKHRLKTKDGKAVYAKRKSTIETTFGIIKAVMGFRKFLLRGIDLVTHGWDLVCMAFNMKRLFVLAK